MENLTMFSFMAAFLVLGIVAGFLLDSETICPTCPTCQACQTCPTPLPCPEVKPVVCEATSQDLLSESIDAFIEELEDDDDLLCNGYNFDSGEVSVYKVYDKYTVEVDEDKTTVNFSVKLKFDEDDERSCHKKYNAKVVFEEDEDPEIDY